MVDERAPSAGEHLFREIQIKIWPWPSGGQVAVWMRSRRGADLVWDRRLGAFGLEAAGEPHTDTAAGVLRAAAAALSRAADDLDDLH